MNNYQPGYVTGVHWAATNGQGAWLNVAEHGLDLEGMLNDVTSTDSGGIAQLIAGKLVGGTTIRAFFDADYPPYLNPPLILPNVGGILLFFFQAVALNRPMQVPMRIGKVHYGANAHDGTPSEWSFDAKLDGLQGALVFPSA